MSLADALLAAPATGIAREAVGAGPAWIVGGAVRDAIRGRPVLDLDLAVPGDPRALARRIADLDGGAAFELSAEHGTWRAIGAERRWHADVGALRGPTIEADLGRRDFTVNAIAVALPGLTGEPIDPFAGSADLRAGVLRAVSPASFADDPLRILRAARLGAELGLELEPGTRALAIESSSRAGEPAGERQLAELRALVAGRDPIAGLALLDELEATPRVLPELAALRGVGQNPNHHLDVHGHTIEVLARLLEVEAELDRYAGAAAAGLRDLLAEPIGDEMNRGEALRFGAILHDVGKPATRREHERGMVSFVGHDRAGAEIVAGACERLRTSRALSRHLQALTLHHLHLGFMARERPLTPRREYEYLSLTAPVAADVTVLTIADRLSARGSGATASAEMIEAHLELAREVLPAALRWHRDGPPRSPIAGDELAGALGIEPGPELGRLLGEIEAAVYTGEVESAADAVALARRLQ